MRPVILNLSEDLNTSFSQRVANMRWPTSDVI